MRGPAEALPRGVSVFPQRGAEAVRAVLAGYARRAVDLEAQQPRARRAHRAPRSSRSFRLARGVRRRGGIRAAHDRRARAFAERRCPPSSKGDCCGRSCVRRDCRCGRRGHAVGSAGHRVDGGRARAGHLRAGDTETHVAPTGRIAGICSSSARCPIARAPTAMRSRISWRPPCRVIGASGVRLRVAGRGAVADGWLGRLGSPHVDLLGPVDDIEPLYDEALALVVPLRYGAGIPTKIVHAAQRGLPSIVSSLAARQVGWQAGARAPRGATIPSRRLRRCASCRRVASAGRRCATARSRRWRAITHRSVSRRASREAAFGMARADVRAPLTG